MADSKTNQHPPHGMQYRKNKYAAPVGGIFIFLAAIGLIALTIFCIRFTQGLLDNSGEKRRFEEVILPVLMFDPVTFENARDLDPAFLLQSSLWSTLLGDKRSSYTYDELGRLMIPATDIDVSCARLFGPEIKLEHQTFGNYDFMYVYDDTTKTYYIPVEGQTGLYTPSVEHVLKKGDQYTLTVGYIPPTNAFTQLTARKGEEIPPDKRMIYELVKVKDYYQLLAVRNMPDVTGATGNTTGLPFQSSSAVQSKPPDPAQSGADAAASSDAASGEASSEAVSSEAMAEAVVPEMPLENVPATESSSSEAES